MPAPTYTIPTNNSDTATEEPKITIALSDLKDLLDGNLDDANLSATAEISYSKLDLTGQIKNADVKSTAAISYSKLASLSSGQLIIGNAGVPTARSVGGAIASISSTGVFTTQYQYDAFTAVINLSITATSWTTLCSLTTAESGTYLIMGKFLGSHTVSHDWGCFGRITQGLGVLDQAAEESASLYGGCSPSCLAVAPLTTGDSIALQGSTEALSGASTSTYARLYMQRLA